MKLNLNNKKTNVIFTILVFVLASYIMISTGIQFYSFSTYAAEFYTSNVDETLKFSDFSPNLKGTVGDSEIYVLKGSQNTVALTKKENAGNYDTLEKINKSNASIVGVTDSAQLTAAKKTLTNKVISETSTAEYAISDVISGAKDIAIVSHEEAKIAMLKNSNLVECEAVVEKVPKLLVIGGTHPNEPSGQLTATVFLESAQVERGVLYVITELNKSAYTHSQPQEATSWYYTLETASGSTRTFKYGSRATNTNQQWPNPDVYTHAQSGQSLSSSEARNINRSYPGVVDGNYTEKVAYAVTELVRSEDITIVIDLHEASPEYITINAMVYHDGSSKVAAKAKILCDDQNLAISVEKSPSSMHGLTHREVGDYTCAYVFLCETSNASQGKLRGAFTSNLITYQDSNDKFYEFAKTVKGVLYAAPVSIDERVARHTQSIMNIITAFNDLGGKTRKVVEDETALDIKYADASSTKNIYYEYDGRRYEYTNSEKLGSFVINNIPTYDEVIANHVGNYLQDLD